jgi:hypothetical protein
MTTQLISQTEADIQFLEQSSRLAQALVLDAKESNLDVTAVAQLAMRYAGFANELGSRKEQL